MLAVSLQGTAFQAAGWVMVLPRALPPVTEVQASSLSLSWSVDYFFVLARKTRSATPAAVERFLIKHQKLGKHTNCVG